MQETIKTFILHYGLISVFVLVFLEYASVPLPSEVVLPFIGIVGAMHNISFISILIVSLVAGIIGSLLNYVIGYIFGIRVLNYVGNKVPKTRKSIEVAYKWIEKYDKGAVFLSRLVPLARTFISVVAGVVKMKPIPFVLFSSVGIIIWNSLLIGLGFMFGNNTALINQVLHQYSLAVGGIVILIIVVLGIRNRKKIAKLFNK